MENMLRNMMMVIHEALDNESLDEMRSNIISLMERVFKSDASTFFLSDKSMKRLNVNSVIYDNLDRDLMNKYLSYFYSKDPFFYLYYFPPVITIGDIISKDKFLKSEYYNEFYRPLKIQHQMTLILKSGKSLIGAITLLRDSKGTPFTSEEKSQAEYLIPYLANATEKYVILNELERKSIMLESLAADLPYKGKIVINELMELVYMDGYAVNLLQSAHVDRSNFSTFINDVLKSFDLKSLYDCKGSINLNYKISENRIINIAIKKIKDRHILIGLEPISSVLNLEQNLNNLGLSSRQKEIAYLIIKGLSNIEIAEKLFISRYTVENHIKNMYDKVNVSNRASFINKVRS